MKANGRMSFSCLLYTSVVEFNFDPKSLHVTETVAFVALGVLACVLVLFLFLQVRDVYKRQDEINGLSSRIQVSKDYLKQKMVDGGWNNNYYTIKNKKRDRKSVV